jgi:hypothetical protein
MALHTRMLPAIPNLALFEYIHDIHWWVPATMVLILRQPCGDVIVPARASPWLESSIKG